MASAKWAARSFSLSSWSRLRLVVGSAISDDFEASRASNAASTYAARAVYCASVMEMSL